MDHLSGITVFVQAAERLSFVGAGRALGISASAVGKSVARLEESLGVRLFHRTTRQVSLTEEGALFHQRCRRILDELRDAQDALSDSAQRPRGRLRISLPTIGYRFLLPIIPEFLRLYPDIELDLDCNDRLVDVVEDGFDAVIRSGPLVDSSLMSRRLGPFRFVLCASPDYLARRGVPLTPRDLEGHDCLRFRFPSSGKLEIWRLSNAQGVDPFAGRAPLVCNNMEALLGATIAGLGIAYMPDFLTRNALESGAVQAVLQDYLQQPGQFSILWPSNRHLSPKLRVFVDFVSARLFRDPTPDQT